MADQQQKTAPSVPKSGKSSQTTTPDKTGIVLPVENPLDLWYLCQKTGFAEKFPLSDSEGRDLKQRQVTRWVQADCRGSGWVWPYWGEVGFNMVPGGGKPPEAIMSRDEPQRPTTMPLSRYEIIRRRVAFQAGIDAEVFPWAEIGLVEPLVTTEYLENNLTPDEVRGAYGKLAPVAESTFGWDLDKNGRPKIPGLLRIPDVIRVHDYKTRVGSDRFVADNIAFLIEIKFEKDVLSNGQIEDYRKLVDYSRDKFRLLETKFCKVSRRKRREWLEKARDSEPVYRSVNGRVTSPKRLLDLNSQVPQAAMLVQGIEEEQQRVRRILEPTKTLDPYLPQMRAADPQTEASRQRAVQQVTLVLDAPLAAAAGSVAIAGAGVISSAATLLGDEVMLVARGAQTLMRFPVGRVAVSATAANSAIYEAAAQPSSTNVSTVPDHATSQFLNMENTLNKGLPVSVLYLMD